MTVDQRYATHATPCAPAAAVNRPPSPDGLGDLEPPPNAGLARRASESTGGIPTIGPKADGLRLDEGAGGAAGP